MTSLELKKVPWDEEYIHIEAKVKKIASNLKRKGLA